MRNLLVLGIVIFSAQTASAGLCRKAKKKVNIIMTGSEHYHSRMSNGKRGQFKTVTYRDSHGNLRRETQQYNRRTGEWEKVD